MEHPCEQCGTLVEEGVVFCPSCTAPQIRVAVPDLPAPTALVGEPLVYEPAALVDRIDWSLAFPAVGWAVLLASVATLGSPGLGMLVAGSLTVVFYRRRRPFLNLSAGMGARLGAVAGAVSFSVLLILLAVAVLGFHQGPKIHDEVIVRMEQYVAQHPAPQSGEIIQMVKSSDGFALMTTFGLGLVLLVCVAFASVAGALSAWLLRRRGRL